MTKTRRTSNVIEMPSSENIAQPAAVDRRDATHAEIAQRAYEIYESRGRIDGYDFEDWLRAKRDLAVQSKAS